jgi:hypothetical protein
MFQSRVSKMIKGCSQSSISMFRAANNLGFDLTFFFFFFFNYNKKLCVVISNIIFMPWKVIIILIPGACEGTLTCSTCHVILSQADYDSLPNKPTDEELDMLDLAFDLTDT